MDNFTVKELAHALSAKAVGNLDIAITGAAEPQDAQGSLLAIATSKSFVARLGEGKAKVALLTTGTDWHCLLYTSPSPRDEVLSRMPSSA